MRGVGLVGVVALQRCVACCLQTEIEKNKVNFSTFQELEPLLANFNFGYFCIFQNRLTITLATFLFSKLANFNSGYFCYFLMGPRGASSLCPPMSALWSHSLA
jgi:hypothetical protein